MAPTTYTSASRRFAKLALALFLAATLPQTAFAAAAAMGTWKIDSAKSKLSGSGVATLTIDRMRGANPSMGTGVFVSGERVYLVTDPATSQAPTITQVEYARMTNEGRAVLIGTNAQLRDACDFRCDRRRTGSRMLLTFKVVNEGGRRVNEMLASDEPRH
jgi:hypothetical protein